MLKLGLTLIKKLLLEKAEEKDEYRKSGKPLGPLHGLPLGLKILLELKICQLNVVQN